jgi:hypothetical protein
MPLVIALSVAVSLAARPRVAWARTLNATSTGVTDAKRFFEHWDGSAWSKSA